jgi:universal stress protein A
MAPELRKLLCPVDFSECSRRAVDYAEFLAHRFDSEVTLLHAWASPVSLYPELSVWVDNAETTLTRAVEAHAQSEMQRLAGSLPDAFRARVRTEVVCGSPLESIVERATSGGFDLIVLGTHGHTGFMHLLVGSVAERVVQHAPCPVLTVRGPRHERA